MYPKYYLDMFTDAIEPTKVFVGMSFNKSEQWRWFDLIKPAIENARLIPYRVDTDIIGGSILDDIVNGIMRAKILIFDVSISNNGYRNGNVMYELGLAHAIRYPEEILTIRSDTESLLFDVANVRIHNYDQNDLSKSVSIITGMIERLVGEIDASKNLVIDKCVSMLDEVAISILHNFSRFKYFSAGENSKAFSIEAIEKRNAVRRLLEMGLLSFVWHNESQKYAYTWTSLGYAILKKLGFGGIQNSILLV